MKAYLRLVSSEGPVTEFPVEGHVEIGRAATGWKVVLRSEGRETPLGIWDAMVSRRHAWLYFEGEQLMIRDAGSLNGTLVDDRLLPQWVRRRGSAPLALKDGSMIKIGNTKIEVRLGTTPLSDDQVKPEPGLPRMHSAEEARRLANSFRMLLEINDQCCNTGTRVKDLDRRLDMLKEYLADKALIAEVNDLQRRIGARLHQEEFLHESQIWEVRNLCHCFVEQWSSRSMR